MGRFFGPTSQAISGSGFTRGAVPAVNAPTFMVVGSDSGNLSLGATPFASWRDASGSWHVISTAAIGGRGLYGVTHVAGTWYATSNEPAGIGSVVAHAADGSPPVAFSATVTGLNQPLTAIAYNTQFIIGTTAGNIITAPLNLSAFTSHPANAPGTYAPVGVMANANGTSYVCVGPDSSGFGICHSADGATWANLGTVPFTASPSTVVSSNSLIWDGVRFVSVSSASATAAVSTDGISWSLPSINGLGNVIAFDALNSLYYVGCTDGTVLVSPTIAGLNTVNPIAVSAHNLRAAASDGGITMMGDSVGGVWVTKDKGGTWIQENPGLGAVVLTGLSAST